MQQYTGTKVIKAKEMSRGEYNKLRGWVTPSDENPEDVGYLVEYVGQGNPNHADFSNYISWSPKQVFEEVYKPSGTPAEMVLFEQAELENKLRRLNDFTKVSTFDLLDSEEKTLLRMQLEVMRTYSSILGLRIARFK
nr:MAG TPA: hypothetical protein [Caudoviricetes sp.]